MKTIWEYRLKNPLCWNILTIPKGFKILCVKEQDDKPCVWCEVERNENDRDIVTFVCFETGEDIPDEYIDFKYIGTLLLEECQYVLHCYCRIETKKPKRRKIKL